MHNQGKCTDEYHREKVLGQTGLGEEVCRQTSKKKGGEVLGAPRRGLCPSGQQVPGLGFVVTILVLKSGRDSCLDRLWGLLRRKVLRGKGTPSSKRKRDVSVNHMAVWLRVKRESGLWTTELTSLFIHLARGLLLTD